MLDGGLHIAVHSLLAHSGVALASNEATSAVRTQQQLSQVLNLLAAILPRVPSLQVMVSKGSLSVLDAHAAEAGPAERIQFLEDHTDMRDQLCDLFLPLMHQIYTVQSIATIREKVWLIDHSYVTVQNEQCMFCFSLFSQVLMICSV